VSGSVLGYHQDQQRYEIWVEEQSLEDGRKTKAIKETNLESSSVPRLPLPTGPKRGDTKLQPSDKNMAPKLCELLLYYKGDFRPSRIFFGGFGGHVFCRQDEHNFMNFVAVQMEQMGGVLGLASLCEQGGEFYAERVLFALLEGDTMYLDVLMQTLYWTGFIRKKDDRVGGQCWGDIPPTRLTPDRDDHPYVKTMAEGPLLLLLEMTKYGFAEALWAAMRNSEFLSLSRPALVETDC
jgi:hypothetical protein